jgi:hypothetical protein
MKESLEKKTWDRFDDTHEARDSTQLRDAQKTETSQSQLRWDSVPVRLTAGLQLTWHWDLVLRFFDLRSEQENRDVSQHHGGFWWIDWS